MRLPFFVHFLQQPSWLAGLASAEIKKETCRNHTACLTILLTMQFLQRANACPAGVQAGPLCTQSRYTGI